MIEEMSFFGWPKKQKSNSRERQLVGYCAFLLRNFSRILKTEDQIKAEIECLPHPEGRIFNKELVTSELKEVRFIFQFIWFLELLMPTHQEELNDLAFTLDYALKESLERANKINQLQQLVAKIQSCIDVNSIQIARLSNYLKAANETVAEKMSRITFDSTGGTFGGEPYDSILELIMTTVARDNKIFKLDDSTNLSEAEVENIKTSMKEMKQSSERAVTEFFEDLDGSNKDKIKGNQP